MDTSKVQNEHRALSVTASLTTIDIVREKNRYFENGELNIWHQSINLFMAHVVHKWTTDKRPMGLGALLNNQLAWPWAKVP